VVDLQLLGRAPESLPLAFGERHHRSAGIFQATTFGFAGEERDWRQVALGRPYSECLHNSPGIGGNRTRVGASFGSDHELIANCRDVTSELNVPCVAPLSYRGRRCHQRGAFGWANSNLQTLESFTIEGAEALP
jgi:hypothetical protein